MTKILNAQVMQVEHEINEDLFYVVASTPHGEVYAHEHMFRDEYDAAKLVGAILDRGEINLDYWHFWRTIYGSEAFREEETEASYYADHLRAGRITMDDIPDNIRTLL